MSYSDASDVVKAGVLERRGLVFGRWKRRFYILRDTFLFVCKSEPNSLADGIAHPSYVIFLNSIGVDCRETQASKSHPHLFTISLKNPKEEHVLSAPSAEERADWVECINSSIKLFTEAQEAEAAASAAALAARAYSRQTSRPGSRSGSRTASPARVTREKRNPRSGSNYAAQTLQPQSSLLDGGDEDNFHNNDHSNHEADHAVGTMPVGGGGLKHSTSSPSRLRQAANGNTPGKQSARKQLFVSTDANGATATPASTSSTSSTPINALNSSPRAAKTVSLQSSATGSSRSKVAAALNESDALGLDAFTLRTRNSILDGDEQDDGADFSSQSPGPQDGRWDSPTHMQRQTQDADLYDEDETAAVQPLSPNPHQHDEPSTPSSAQYQSQQHPQQQPPIHRRTVSSTVASYPTSPRSPQPRTGGHAPSQSISALDEDTRLKLKQIEQSSNDPELLALLAEHQVLDDKIAKLKLHKKVLGNELKLILPKLAVQQKVNQQFSEEIAFHRGLKNKRTAHRIQVCNWALGMKQRLAASEPAVIMKAQRRQAQQYQQQQLQMQQIYGTGHHHPQQQQQPPHGYASPISHRGASPNSLSAYNSPYTPSSTSTSTCSSPPFTPPPAGVKFVHSELVRASNAELDTIESELRARRPEDAPSAHVLSALEKEEAMYTDADASVRPPAFQHEHQQRDPDWDRQRGVSEQNATRGSTGYEEAAGGGGGGSNGGISRKSASAPDAVSPTSASSTNHSGGHDSHYLLLRSHTQAMNDFTHVLTNILLREVAIRRQLNLLQHSIYKLTSEKESSFRAKHALASSQALSSTKNKKASKVKGKSVY